MSYRRKKFGNCPPLDTAGFLLIGQPVTNLTALIETGHQVSCLFRRWCVHREGTTLHRLQTNDFHCY